MYVFKPRNQKMADLPYQVLNTLMVRYRPKGFHRWKRRWRWDSLSSNLQQASLLRVRIKNFALNIMKSSSALSLLLFLILDRNILIETKSPHAGSTRASRQNNRIFHPKSIFFNRSLISVPTVTLSSSTTVTQTDTTSTVCAKLVNVTGPCLRRRGAWVEEPIVLSFHGDFDDTFDLMYSSVLGYVRILLSLYCLAKLRSFFPPYFNIG